MRVTYCIFVFMFLIGLPFLPVLGQDSLELDISMEMPNIETIEGSMSVPANLNLLLQGIIKIFADENGDDYITQAESDAFLDLMPEEERDNLSLSLEDLEPLIQTSIGIDFRQPTTIDVQDMEFIGLVGPVNSSQPLGFLVTFRAEFNVFDSLSHTISIGINESYTGDVNFEFTIPSGWDFDTVSGLLDSDIEGQTVYGTPVSQINIEISEGLSDEVLYICIGIGAAVFIIIVIVIALLLWKKGKKDPNAPREQYPGAAPPPYPGTQPQQPPQQYQGYAYQQTSPAPVQAPAQAPPPRAPIPPPPAQLPVNSCPVCRTPMSYIKQYQRYYCNNCRQYR